MNSVVSARGVQMCWRTTPAKSVWIFGRQIYRELVQREDISVIAIYSPDHLQAEHCVAAIEAGKHVICTKPMVTKLADAQQLVNLVREAQGQVPRGTVDAV